MPSRSFQPPRPPRAPRAPTTLSRRELVIGGGAGAGLLLAWAAWPRGYRPNLVAAPGETVMGAFLKIGEDGHVTVVVPQAEMGQGTWTSLPQILADELGADWRTIGVEPAPIGPLYANTLLMEEAAADAVPGLLAGPARWAAGEMATRSSFMMTAGSTSIRAFEQRLREAGATARVLLQMAVAEKIGVDWRALDTGNGFVTHGDETFRFGDHAAAAAKQVPPRDLPLREPGAGGLSGRPVARLDLPAKIDGSAQYAGDVRLPGMVYASVRHGPHGDARLAHVDEAAALRVPGVLRLLKNPRWVAAVAANTWAAERALDRAAPRFAGSDLPDDRSIARALDVALAGDDARTMAGAGDVAGALAAPGLIEATYSVPFAVHAPIETLTATARATGDRLEVWAPTQAPGLARAAAARATGRAEAQVTIYPMLVGGGFGRKIEVDAIEQAAIVATMVQRPVQLCWPRAEETMHGRFRPPARARLSAVLGQGGMIQAWRARIAAPATMAALNRRLMPGVAIGAGGGAEAAAVAGALPPYAIPAVGIDHAPADIGVETGVWRSAAHSYTGFFTEGFMDELAARAGQDPMTFRMQHLGSSPRLARCLSQAAAAGGWDGAGKAQGVAVHSAFGSHIALLAEAELRDGAVKVSRIVAAVDCGRVIHPEIVRQQIEGAIIWGLSAALGPRPGFVAGVATVRGFADLRLPRLADTPAIEVHVIDSRAAPGGVAELGVPPVAPAIANALFGATGTRLRDLPLGARA